MGDWYSRWIFPLLCDLVMSCGVSRKLRRQVLRPAHGNVLEIGVGTGLNLAHYPRHVRRITTVDPNPGMNRLLKRRMVHSGLEVDHHVQSSERMPFAADSFDCVVSTWTMCSIANLPLALEEIRRVLKPGGQLLFVEHGLSDNVTMQAWQRRLNWLEGRLADGCRLDIDFAAIFAAQRYSEVNLEKFAAAGLPATHGSLYRGVARK